MAASAARDIERATGLPLPVCELLARRGHADPEAARRFLRPDLSALPPPAGLPDLAAAADRVERALERGETILVHGDFDVDGMSAAALLVRALRELGGRATGFVPHRTRDGYDLGEAGLRRASEIGAALIVTADCGISAHEAVERAGRAGIDVVVTDHHRPGRTLPAAVAVVDAARDDSSYPHDGLTGVGVAFKLVAELHRRRSLEEGRLNQHLDLVALGTIADQAPLVGENRALVRFGLRALARSRKPGVRALLRAAGVPPGGRVRASDVAFRLAPRLNSVGRMGSAEEGLRLLLADDPAEAEALARRVDRQNELRRATDRRVLREAGEALERRFDPDRDRVVVLWGEGWHPGVLGITASRLVDRLHRPTVLLAFAGEAGRGSARSVEGFHLFRALQACEPALDRYGGHAMAAGFDIRRSRLDEFVTRLRAYAARELPPEPDPPELRIDLVLPLEEVTPRLERALRHLGPFGEANPAPVLAVEAVRFEDVRRLGEDGRHVRATLRARGASVEAIGFGLGERVGELPAGALHDVAFELETDVWRGRERTRARILDVRAHR